MEADIICYEDMDKDVRMLDASGRYLHLCTLLHLIREYYEAATDRRYYGCIAFTILDFFAYYEKGGILGRPKCAVYGSFKSQVFDILDEFNKIPYKELEEDIKNEIRGLVNYLKSYLSTFYYLFVWYNLSVVYFLLCCKWYR